VTGAWNLDGKGYSRIPVEKGQKFAKFATEKKREFITGLGTSLAMGIVASLLLTSYI